MKNKKFWITSAVLAVVIITVALVSKYGGRKVKIMDEFINNGPIWIFTFDSNGELKVETSYDSSMRYVILPYFYKGRKFYYNGIEYTAIPVKAVGIEDGSGKVRRIYVQKGSYVSLGVLEIYPNIN